MSQAGLDRGARFLLAGACTVIIIAGLRSASDRIAPVPGDAFLDVVSLPPRTWLRQHGVPGWAAAGALPAVVVGVLMAATALTPPRTSSDAVR